MTFNQLVAKRTRQLLKARNWTQYKLANRSAIPFSTLDYLIHSRGKTITLETLLNICRGFEITLSEFFSVPLFELENIDDD